MNALVTAYFFSEPSASDLSCWFFQRRIMGRKFPWTMPGVKGFQVQVILARLWRFHLGLDDRLKRCRRIG
jgi:hypothetical protein